MDLPVKLGDLVGGKYLIEALLGTGGMGAVFLAKHEQLHRRVAIKFLLSDAMSNPDAFARFEREAHAAAALQSDYVTRVIDMGATTEGTPYIVMEYLEGQDLSAKLTAEGTLPVDRAVAYIIEACDALSEAHALGIVHRDLKPANLFLARRPNGTTRVKVLDFGISKMSIHGKAMSLTGTGAVMGSPLYMSPEQLRGSGKVDERTDIWSLGIVLYEFLAGSPPFLAEAFPEQCALILTAPVPPLHERRPDVPPALEAIVTRCLAKDPGARFSSAAELTAALLGVVPNADLAPSRPVLPRMVSTDPDMTNAPTMAVASIPGISGSQSGNVTPVPLSSTGDRVVKSRLPLTLGIAAACALAGIGGVLLLSGPRPDPGAGMVSHSTAATPPAASSAATAPPPPASAAVADPPASAAPAASVAPAAPSAAPPPAVPPHATAATPVGHKGGHPTAPAASAAPAKDCSTPYFFDPQGNKVFKPECLK